MTLVAYVQGSSDPLLLGNLKDGGTLTVEGVAYDIPAGNTLRGDRSAPDRIARVLAGAGYRLAADYVYAVEPPNRDGKFELRVVKA